MKKRQRRRIHSTAVLAELLGELLEEERKVHAAAADYELAKGILAMRKKRAQAIRDYLATVQGVTV